jgi:1-acyl-sn-glycerol-3-phosphate acyltransferase
MKIIKSIAGRLFAVWGIIWFVATLLVFIIPFVIVYYSKEPQRTHRFVKLSRIWMSIYLPVIGCPLRITGKERFKKGETYVVVCNHNSLMDVPITTPGIPGGNKTIAKASMAKLPLFGLIYRIGSVLVDRNSEASRRESYMRMKEVLDMGLHMCLYPEGTRNKTGQPLKAFHNGAFKLALDTGKPIMPAVLFHTRGVLPVDRVFFLWPHRLQMDFLEPVYIMPGDTVESLKEKLFKLMWDYYERKTSNVKRER